MLSCIAEGSKWRERRETRRRGGTVVHLEAHRLVATPPATESWSVTFFATGFFLHVDGAVLFVHEEAGDGARAGVHVLVITPGGKVDVPFVELDVDVAYGVREVPANQDIFGVRVSGDSWDVEVLAGVVLNAG